MNTFEAIYAGNCGTCSSRIEVGDEVLYLSGGDSVLVHVECDGDMEEVSARKTETCTECWILKPCGC